MDLDIQTAVIGGLTFVVCAGVLLFISKFGMKEKSYDEALVERRKYTSALLGVHKSVKPKEKKAKKSTKKVKEKKHRTTIIESETAEESEDTDSPITTSGHSQQKLHVEFKEPTIIEEPSAEESMPNIIPKQKSGKKNKVRPILIHKLADIPTSDIIEAPATNHFEQLHPKDEFELLHSHITAIKEDPSKVEPTKEKPSKLKQNDSEDAKEKHNKSRNSSVETKEYKDNKNKQQILPSNESNKEKQNLAATEEIQKSRKQPKLEVLPHTSNNEETILDVPAIVQQTNGYVPSVAKEKKKKKIDANNLHHLTGAKDADVNLNLLLNAVRKAELSRSEVQILIDLLLNKQHEAPATLDEWSEGKADPIQKLKRQLAEKEKALVEEQEALAGAQAKLREIRTEQIAERVQLQQRNRGLEEAFQAKHLELQALNGRLLSQNQKIQQMQAQINEEAMLLRSAREENAGLQLQRQQLDIHISQTQEAEVTIQDLQSRNNQLAIELHTLTEQNMATKDHQQNVIVQLQHQINHFKGELDEKENINRQLDDLRRDLEHRLSITHRIENELKVELSQLKSVCQQHAEEVRRLDHNKGQALEEARNLQKQKEEVEHLVSQLTLELRNIKTENAELQMLRANGIEQESEAHKAEVFALQNELSSTKSEVFAVEKQMRALKEDHASAIAEYKESLSKLQTNMDEQKDKNNELRKKNWKVMDALKAAEGKLAETPKQLPSADEIASRIRNEEQQTNIKFIERLFPSITVSKDVAYNEWVENVEKYVETYQHSLEKRVVAENQSEIEKLQAQLQHYKAIVDDTEGILKKLQNHIEQEEVLWRKEMANKDLEIETFKKQHSSELTKVQQLELQLAVEVEAKQKLAEQYEQMKTSQSSAITANSAIIDRLSEEVKQLHHQLSTEKSRNSELLIDPPAEVSNSSHKLENNSSSNGPLLEQREAK